MAPEEHPPDSVPVEAQLDTGPEDVSNQHASEAAAAAANGKTSQVVTAELVAAKPNRSSVLPDAASSRDNVAAKGGAIGALVLGGWSIVGAFITPFSVVNAILGFILGLWGASSPQFRLAYVGIGLSGLGLIMSLMRSVG